MNSNKSETVATESSGPLEAQLSWTPETLEIRLRLVSTTPVVLHWGVRNSTHPDWQLPNSSSWPGGTRNIGQNALQTPFQDESNHKNLTLRLEPVADYQSLDFVLYFPNEKRWDNNRGKNYQLRLVPSQNQSATAPGLASTPAPEPEQVIFKRVFQLENNSQLESVVSKAAERVHVRLSTSDSSPLTLHWGVCRQSPMEWLLPPPSVWPKETSSWQGQAARTPFHPRDGCNQVTLQFPDSNALSGLQFVLVLPGQPERWLKYRGGNFYLPFKTAFPATLNSEKEHGAEWAARIIGAETTHNSWTLMHRFNLCYELLSEVQEDLHGLALLYVWLRYSAIRQLTWQRNYNTKPRELAHAQDRLTQKLAEVYRGRPSGRTLIRWMLATVGPGGEGQKIRDEILAIMHRHHVKEVSGHFLEEWHQKLHNNTTPDDVVICEAFLEFLRTHGDLHRFYQTLEAGGVTRQRLASFERPIRSEPQFVPHLKDGLIHDFQNFLHILKASHSGTDLEVAFNSFRNQLDGELQHRVRQVRNRRNDPGIQPDHFVREITEIRKSLRRHWPPENSSRELLYLDLALEQLVRTVVERNLHLQLAGGQLVLLVECLLENLLLAIPDPALSACLGQWQRLSSTPRFDENWSLHAKSVVDRMARALSAWLDLMYGLLQPKAEVLGFGFRVEEWTISLFSEEVLRGNSVAFALSSLLRLLDPLLRKAAHLGDWQIVSRGQGSGTVMAVDNFSSTQNARFDSPAVIVASRVSGNEEIVNGIVAVIAPDVTDIVSHVAVRARNAGILFATCHNPELLNHLKSLQGRVVQLEVDAAGSVCIAENVSPKSGVEVPVQRPSLQLQVHEFTQYAVGFAQFSNRFVGAKAMNLRRLRAALPDWLSIPSSVALPFGTFEHVLNLALNQGIAQRFDQLQKRVDSGELALLSTLRETVLQLQAPDSLRADLLMTLAKENLPQPSDWNQVWQRIKQVWASKWNERAVLSRKRFGIPTGNLSMSVLVQAVIRADYAFVLHSSNPMTGNRNEVYGEVVLGLGETLVGNFPGRALSFTWDKTTRKSSLLSFPGKETALFGSGLIFRSDSNAEDLGGYAGAGLYDSVLLEPPRPVLVDYANEPLVWNETFRSEVLQMLGRIAVEVERAFGQPQDIEGAVTQGRYSIVQSRPQITSEG